MREGHVRLIGTRALTQFLWKRDRGRVRRGGLSRVRVPALRPLSLLPCGNRTELSLSSSLSFSLSLFNAARIHPREYPGCLYVPISRTLRAGAVILPRESHTKIRIETTDRPELFSTRVHTVVEQHLRRTNKTAEEWRGPVRYRIFSCFINPFAMENKQTKKKNYINLCLWRLSLCFGIKAQFILNNKRIKIFKNSNSQIFLIFFMSKNKNFI